MRSLVRSRALVCSSIPSFGSFFYLLSKSHAFQLGDVIMNRRLILHLFLLFSSSVLFFSSAFSVYGFSGVKSRSLSLTNPNLGMLRPGRVDPGAQGTDGIDEV